jgi:hypothetical protein
MGVKLKSIYILSKKVTGPSALPVNINHHGNKNIEHAPKIAVVKQMNELISFILLFSYDLYNNE